MKYERMLVEEIIGKGIIKNTIIIRRTINPIIPNRDGGFTSIRDTRGTYIKLSLLADQQNHMNRSWT